MQARLKRREAQLAPKSSSLLPVRYNLEGDHPPWPVAQLPVHKERQISAKQPQLTTAHHTMTTACHPDYNHSSALVGSRSTQFMARPSCEPRRPPPETRSRFCYFQSCCYKVGILADQLCDGNRGSVVESNSYTKLKMLDVQEGKKDKLFADHVTQICKAHTRVIG